LGGISSINDGATTNYTSIHVDNGIDNNGVYTTAVSKALATATTTPCAVLSPNATSTMMFSTFNVTTSTSTAVTLTVATSTTAFATTTVLNAFSLASGAQGMFTQLSTSSAGAVMAPSTYVVWGVAGFAPADTAKFLGKCSVEFKIAN
jgi:hypothetical protein